LYIKPKVTLWQKYSGRVRVNQLFCPKLNLKKSIRADWRLSNSIAMKLVDDDLVETTNKNSLEEQIKGCLEKLGRADDFEIDYQMSPIRNLVPQPHVVSLFLTAFVIEKLIKHKDVVDIYGSDEDIYLNIHQQVKKYLPA
jgi:hypothetical protein